MSKFLGKSQKGFTLIELMIVVAIIGILAAIAIPNFIRFQLKAKTSEGKVNVAAIRTSEEAYFSEFGTYVDGAVSPTAFGGTTKTVFADQGGFGKIGWAPEGQVYFNYEVVTSANGKKAYVAAAAADIDGNTVAQAWGYVHPAAGNTTTAGTTPTGDRASCLATGIPTDAASPTFNQVLPCVTTHGQSIF